jgi:uncharacterized protein
LRRALAKAHPRIVAVDDGAFARSARTAPLAAVVVSLPAYVESIRAGRVAVDGTDATEQVIALVRATGPLDGLRALLLDGAVVGGFNVLDLDELARQLRLPVVAVTRRRPDYARIRDALKKWFPRDHAVRWRSLRAHPLFPVSTGARPIFAAVVGGTRADAIALLHRSAVRGYWPEALRVAHLVASAGARPRRRPKD